MCDRPPEQRSLPSRTGKPFFREAFRRKSLSHPEDRGIRGLERCSGFLCPPNNSSTSELLSPCICDDGAWTALENDETREPLVFWDTQGGDFPERPEDEENTSGNTSGRALLMTDSKSNEMEAALVRMHVKKLIAAGVQAGDIAVVTRYNSHLALLAQDLKEQLNLRAKGNLLRSFFPRNRAGQRGWIPGPRKGGCGYELSAK